MGSAMQSFKQALAIDPESDNARYHLGLAKLMAGYRAEAMAEFQKLLFLHPGHMKGRIDLAVLLLSEGKPGEALKELDEVLSKTDNAKAAYYKAVTLRMMGSEKKALAVLNALIKKNDPEYGPKALALKDEGKDGRPKTEDRRAAKRL